MSSETISSQAAADRRRGGWESFILRDGNFYGDNIVCVTVPFNVGATVQTNLGGNVGFSN